MTLVLLQPGARLDDDHGYVVVLGHLRQRKTEELRRHRCFAQDALLDQLRWRRSAREERLEELGYLV